jgi:hypothetical protein
MIKSLIFACIIQFSLINVLFSQDNLAGKQEGSEQAESIKIMFWNPENFFDPFDDSLTNDEDFTSHGIYAWTWSRFNRKLNNIYKVIMSSGWNPPDIIGLAEVENRWVLERLADITPFSKFEYRIIHKDSPDVRGIDVALLYLPDSFRPIHKSFITVTGLKPGDDPTRDILYVKGIVNSHDTVNVFVNHWPSRYPGQTETMHKREAAAMVLRRFIDSLFLAEPLSSIIVMGDFNDEPQDKSISETLGAIVPEFSFDSVQVNGTSGSPDKTLFCLVPFNIKTLPGTIKFEGRWYMFDQFMISGGLLAKSVYNSAILDHDFLFEPDEAYAGRKPFRTYNGYIYRGGYSDHLPVILNLSVIR